MGRNCNLKVLLILFFEHEGMVYYEYVPQVKTMNCDYYIGVLQCFRDAVKQKWLHYRQGDHDWHLHCDNACPHTVHKIQHFLMKDAMIFVPRPPYSCNYTSD